MILSVSDKTDIVAFYSEWFMNRYKEGYVDVRESAESKKVTRINFDDVDMIYFCTKNPIPMLENLKEIDKPMLFHVTVTPYRKEIEREIVSKHKVLDAIKVISDTIGIDNVCVRYDPVFFSDKYNLNYHKQFFDSMCCLLEGSVKKIIISFLTDCESVKKNVDILKNRPVTGEEYKELAMAFSESAKKYGMTVQTCTEDESFVEYGFVKGECLSKKMVKKIAGKECEGLSTCDEKKCKCVQMVDIGVENSCAYFCKYCYANCDEKKIMYSGLNHNPKSSLLVGELADDDIIEEKKN